MHDNPHSSIDSDFKMSSAVLPQHQISAAHSCGETTATTRARRRASGVLSLALPCILIAASAPNGHALSLSSASTSAGVSSSWSGIVREPKKGSKNKARRRLSVATETKSLPDNDALSAALFDDGLNLSLESAVANLKHKKKSDKTAQQRAEEFDRFMEEDLSVASIVQENIKPGSLVDAVQQCKGADVVDMEILMQREAADRRSKREAEGRTIRASPPPSVKVTRKTKLSSKPQPPKRSPNKSRKISDLLTREQEYALAYTIQAGAGVHKLKADYESSNGVPLSKRDWAERADMSPNELRKLVSDYRTAKKELVSSNMGLVHAVVRSYSSKARYRGTPLDELVQEGALGLIRAAELFDPAKGLRFSTYATIWIKGVLSNSNVLDDVILLPQRERTLGNKVQAAWEELARENGRAATQGKGKPAVSSAKEIAARLGMEQSLVENHLRRMACVTNVLSLDYQYTTSTRSGFADSKQEVLMNSAQFGTDADLAEHAQLKADVVTALVRTLSEKELTLMRLRYGLEDGTEYTVKECASRMGINRETARLLQHACLKKLREASNMKSLQEYLLTVA